MDSSHLILAGVRRRQSDVVQKFLWTLLGVVASALLLNMLLLGGDAFTVRALAPNAVFVSVIGVALWLNRRRRFEAALTLITALILGSVAIGAVAAGGGPAGAALVLLFVPLVLMGLLMGRRALYLSAGAALVILLVPPLLRQVGVLPPVPATFQAGTTWLVPLQYAIVVVIVAFFLDRFGSALREALLASVRREVQLEAEMEERRKAETSVREEKAFSDAIVERLPDLFFVTARDGTFVQWKPSFATAVGREEEDLRGVHARDLFVATAAGSIEDVLAEASRTGSATAEARLATSSGEVPVYLTVGRVSRGGTDVLVGVGLDTSELTAARERIEGLNRELERRLAHITALREIDRAITGSLDLDLTLKVILEQVTRQLRVDAASVLLYRPRRETLVFGGATGFRTDALRSTRLRLGEGQAGRAALGRETVTIDDADAFARAFADAERISAEEFRFYIAAPLVSKGQLRGVLELFHRSRPDLDDSWFSFLDALLTQVAIALDGATMFESLERSNAELRVAYDTTIEGWARALDLRDEETVGHSRRVTDMTMRLAEAMGVADDALVHIRRGALLHDIGKMGVPDRILLKAGPLNEGEWEAMKRHTTHAFELLAPIAFLKPALDIPYAHHERWDGTGYPRGLEGQKIPFAARIFAVADVYDALTSDRPYRSAWTHERALAHVRDAAGTHFDPAVVDAFLGLMERHDGPVPPEDDPT